MIEYFAIRNSTLLIVHSLATTLIGNSDIEWGKSYIGQDVCGSKYNDDPFTEQENKPDAWEEMKKRIQAIEDRKKLEELQANKALQEKNTVEGVSKIDNNAAHLSQAYDDSGKKS